MKKKLLIGGSAGVVAIVLTVVFLCNQLGHDKSDVEQLAKTIESISEDKVPLAFVDDEKEADAPEATITPAEENDSEDVATVEDADAEEVLETEEMISEEVPADFESVEIFSGKGEYESSDVAWLLNAPDNAVVTVIYSCTDDTHGGWGILGWGATIDGAWVNGPEYKADSNKPTGDTYSTITVKEMKAAFGIKKNSNVEFIKLGCWNGGKIISINLSTAKEAKDLTKGITKAEAAVTEEATEEASAQDVIASVTTETKPAVTAGRNIGSPKGGNDVYIENVANSSSAQSGDTVRVSVTLSSTGYFNGTIGANAPAWVSAGQMECNGGTTTWSAVFEECDLSSVQFQVWYADADVYVVSSSIELVKKNEKQVLASANASFNVSTYAPDYEVGDKIKISVKLTTTGGGGIGASAPNEGWEQVQYSASGTVTLTLVSGGDYFEVQNWWGTTTIESISVTIVKKANPSSEENKDEENTGDEENNEESGSEEQGGNENQSGNENQGGNQTPSGNENQGGNTPSEETPSEETKDFEVDWGKDYTVDSTIFENLKFDGSEKLVITYKSINTAEWGSQIKLATASPYSELTDCKNLSIAADYKTYELVLNNEDIAEAGMLVQGWNIAIQSVSVEAVTAEPEREVIPFTDSMTFNYSDFDSNFKVGDHVVVEITMSNDGFMNGCVGANDNGEWTAVSYEINDATQKITLEIMNADESFQVQKWWMNEGVTATIDNITVAIIPVFAPIAFDGNKVFKYADLNENYQVGDHVIIKVTLTDDGYMNGCIGANDGGNWSASDMFVVNGETKELTFEVQDAEEDFQVQQWYINPDVTATIDNVVVEIVEEEGQLPTDESENDESSENDGEDEE